MAPDAKSGAKAAQPSGPTGRLSAVEIFDRVVRAAEDELSRPVRNLAFSAVAAGITMGLSGLAVALIGLAAGSPDLPVGAELTGSARVLAAAGYPIGFMVVILGRQQLFTENTLFPVALVLDRHRLVGRTARLWAVVLAGNMVGALVFALLAVRTAALPDDARRQLASLGREVGEVPLSRVLWSAVIAGWVIALVAWMVTAALDTTAQLLGIFALTYLVGLGRFAHSVAGMCETLSATLAGELGAGRFLAWAAAAVAGNVCGGVVMVALLNYAQVRGQTAAEEEEETVSELAADH